MGSMYGRLPRVVVVSLDAGGETKSLREKRADVERVTMENGNPHMRGTITVLRALFGLGEKVSPLPFCAITNAAKCTAGDGKRDMVPGALFVNCRALALAELEILIPQVVVTQGVQARSALSDVYDVPTPWLDAALGSLAVAQPPVQDWLRSLSDEYLCVWSCESTIAIVLRTPHPSARMGQWQQFARTSLGPLAWLVMALLPSASGGATQGPEPWLRS